MAVKVIRLSRPDRNQNTVSVLDFATTSCENIATLQDFKDIPVTEQKT